MTSKRSLGIDALRGLAALAVVFHHSYAPQIGVFFYEAFLSFFRRYGMLGVDLFFVLSGFCIHGAYWDKEGKFSTPKYLARRWWRIYPPYFFALGFAVLLNLGTNYYKWKTGGQITFENFGSFQILSHLFLVNNLSQKTMLTVSGPFWTIATEAQYYLLYLILRPLFYSPKGWGILWGTALTLYFFTWSFIAVNNGIELLNPFCFWVEWVAGAFLVTLLKNERVSLGIKRASPFLAFFAFATAGWLMGKPELPFEISRLLFTAAFSFLIIFFLGQEALWQKSAFRWLPGVGIFSYSIYLIHFLFLDRVRIFLVPVLPEGWPRMAVSVGSIGIVLALAYLFFIFFEKPFLDKAAAIR